MNAAKQNLLTLTIQRDHPNKAGQSEMFGV